MNQNNEVPTKLHAKLITVATIGAVGGFLFGYDTSVINGAVDAIASPDSGFGLNAAMSGFSVSSAKSRVRPRTSRRRRPSQEDRSH